jgi:hypothetical protein
MAFGPFSLDDSYTPFSSCCTLQYSNHLQGSDLTNDQRRPCQDNVLRPIKRHRSILTSHAGGASSTTGVSGSKDPAYQLQQYKNAPAHSDPWTSCGVGAKPKSKVIAHMDDVLTRLENSGAGLRDSVRNEGARGN